MKTPHLLRKKKAPAPLVARAKTLKRAITPDEFVLPKLAELEGRIHGLFQVTTIAPIANKRHVMFLDDKFCELTNEMKEFYGDLVVSPEDLLRFVSNPVYRRIGNLHNELEAVNAAIEQKWEIHDQRYYPACRHRTRRILVAKDTGMLRRAAAIHKS